MATDMEQEIREKTKFIFSKIRDECSSDGQPYSANSQRQLKPVDDKRKNQGSLHSPPALNRSRN